MLHVNAHRRTSGRGLARACVWVVVLLVVPPLALVTGSGTVTQHSTGRLAAAHSAPTAARSSTTLPSGPASAPPSREYSSMTWDAADHYFVLFGGFGPSPGGGGSTGAFADTWVLANGTWNQLHPATSPPPLVGAAMAYDPNSSEVVLFGGYNCTIQSACWLNASSTTWVFHAGVWTPLTLPLTPSPRVIPSLAYDPQYGGLVLYGGYAAGGSTGNGSGMATANDTWTFVNGTWTKLTLAGSHPPARWQAGMAYDPNANSLYLFGGARDNSVSTPLLNDTWALANGSWTNVGRPFSPPRSAGMGFDYVSSDKAIVLFGGINNTYDFPLNATWELVGGSWTRLVTSVAPPARWSTTFVNAPSLGYGVLFGGNSYSPEATDTYGGLLNDSWTFSHGNWSALGSNASAPPPGGSQMAFDAVENETVLLSPGPLGSTNASGATWIYSGDSWTPTPPPPFPIAEPSARTQAAMAYDAKDGYILLYGGTSARPHGPLLFNDTWKFQGGSWSRLYPAHNPGGRYDAVATYDAKDGYLLMLGGQGYSAVGLAWAWNGTDWAQVASTGAVPPSVGYVDFRIAYDAVDGYVVITQAANETCAGVTGNCLRTWSFVGGTWTDLTKTTALPPPVIGYSLAWDAGDQVVVLFGGYVAGSLYNQTWEFSAGAWSQTGVNPAPYPRYQAALTYDAGDGYLLMFGGFGPNTGSGPTYFGDTWSFAAGAWTQRIPSLAESLASVDVGVTVNLLTVSGSPGGVPTYAYSGLPPGCASLDLPGLGCRPTAPGNYTIAVRVSYPGGTAAQASVELAVRPSPSIAAFEASVVTFALGNRTTLTVSVTGGTGPYSFAYLGLPPGCVGANVSSLPCTPVLKGNYTVQVQSTDVFGESSNASLLLHVTPAVVPPGQRGHPHGNGSAPSLLGLPTGLALVLVIGVATLVIGGAAVAARSVRRARLRREGEELIQTMRSLDGPDKPQDPGPPW
ncbi:MAG: hypothetical protein L3K23_10000 [Thermoplasmata archaeon]|nr:hypothetical protein [Thermoplasmata archaeon]